MVSGWLLLLGSTLAATSAPSLAKPEEYFSPNVSPEPEEVTAGDELADEYEDETATTQTVQYSNLPLPSPSCMTYPRKSVVKKRSRYKLQAMKKESSTRDILSQLDDEIEEQEMDKRSRIELLSYLDAAIKNKNIELNLELRHLAKEEEILNQKEQDGADNDRSVLYLNSNIDQLTKRIKDLDGRIVKLNKIKAEKAAQERELGAQAEPSDNRNPAFGTANYKIPNPLSVDGKKMAPFYDPTIGNRPPNVVSHPLSDLYVDPLRVYGVVAPETPKGAEQSAWFPAWGNQRWDAMYPSRLAQQYPDIRRIVPPYSFLPRQQPLNTEVQFDPASSNV